MVRRKVVTMLWRNGWAALIAGCVGAVLLADQQPARTPDILFVPTREVVADQMLMLARVTADDVVYDLGSGDGRIVNLAAQKYGARGVGIELQPRLVEIARQVARDAGIVDKVTFLEGDLFSADISRATVVTLYLSPSVNRTLESKLRRELAPGTRIVSHQFPIGQWEPDRVVRADDKTDLFLWTVRREAGGNGQKPGGLRYASQHVAQPFGCATGAAAMQRRVAALL
jgi:SAM-dependent methyltransferase